MKPEQIKQLRLLADRTEGAASTLREALDEVVKDATAEPEQEAPEPAAPVDRVTVESIEAKIVSEDYLNREGTTLTLCVLTLANGFTVTGESACVDPRNFDPELGRKYAREAAFEKIWPLEGYLLREQMAKREARMAEPVTGEGACCEVDGCNGCEAQAADEGWDACEPVESLAESWGPPCTPYEEDQAQWRRQQALEAALKLHGSSVYDADTLAAEARKIEAFLRGDDVAKADATPAEAAVASAQVSL